LSNAKNQLAIVMPFPTGADLGFELAFSVPANYSGSPVLVIRGILDGTPANAIAWGALELGVADSETIDAAYETEDLTENSTWTGYAIEEMYEQTLTLTPAAAYQPGDTIYLHFFRNDSSDTTTFDFVLTDLLFRYAEA
jgi:hypothetical protein